MLPPATDVTDLLRRWSAGESEALDQLIPIVYDRLRQLAHHRIRREHGQCSLDTTGLVHEAYLRLVRSPNPSLRDRGHFLALTSRVMRNLLVDHARRRRAMARADVAIAAASDPLMWIPEQDVEAVHDLDEALTRLEAFDPRKCRILEQRYFGGLSLDETAAALDLSLATIKRELRSARAWLASDLGEGHRLEGGPG